MVSGSSLVRVVAVSVETRSPLEFVDITDTLSRTIDEAGLVEGLLVVQTRHTTTGVMINEHEPLLLADFEAMFERLAPMAAAYEHDDFGCRTDVAPNERRNGHAHCRAALLRASEYVAVSDRRLNLGRWQRVFLVDFDGGQRREMLVTLLGVGAEVRG
ncbi:MAG TPA: secondary thiamine-phosphate synthase enzyme YjbQ [Vicinamibacterales bacterium]|nr:secondary thiamine-phosphate synthase enzyme YjbQ [Vicinamibacterales bacterium]